MPWLEIVGNIFTVWCVFLAARNNKQTWVIGTIGCILFGIMFYGVKLYADATLQIFFIITNVIGYWSWKHGSGSKELQISRVKLKGLASIYFPLAVITAIGYGMILHLFTDASAPFIDSVVLTFSVVGQFLLMRRKLESWIFWIIVDLVSVPLFAYKGLYITSAVYFVFLLNAFYGFWKWQKEYKAGK